MGRRGPPPRYANIPTWLLFEVQLPRSVRLTGMRIYALGWNHNYEYTDHMTREELCEWCELSRSQIHDHLFRLVSSGVLRYTLLDRAGHMGYVFDLRPTRAHGVRGSTEVSPEIRTHGALSVVVVSSPSITEDSLNLQEEKQQQQVVSESWGECEGGAGRVSKMRLASPENRIEREEWEVRLEVLEALGVLEPTRSELAELEHVTVEYLEGWEDWFLTQDVVGSGFIVCRVRDGDVAPVLSRDRVAQRDRQRRAAELGIV